MEKIPPAERAQFWKFARENNAGAIKEKITFLMRRHETWEKRYQSGGNYLPLSVWATQGYDTQRIERLSRPEDIMEDHVLGKVYRVPVLGVWENGTKGRSITDDSEARPAKRRRQAAPALPPPPAEEEPAADDPAGDSEPGEDPESGESSDSSSSSSESSGKHKKKKKDKKKKKGKKDKKDKEKARKKEREEKQRERERQREAAKKEREDARAAAAATRAVERAQAQQERAEKSQAAAVQKQVDKSVASLDGTLRSAGANLVDNTLKTALIAEREALLQLRQSCESVYEGIPLPEGQPDVPDLKTLKKKLELLRKQEACLKMAISNAVLQAQALMG